MQVQIGFSDLPKAKLFVSFAGAAAAEYELVATLSKLICITDKTRLVTELRTKIVNKNLNLAVAAGVQKCPYNYALKCSGNRGPLSCVFFKVGI